MDPIQAANELAFRVGFSGHSGHLRLEPLSTEERRNPLRSIPDFIPVSHRAVDPYAFSLLLHFRTL